MTVFSEVHSSDLERLDSAEPGGKRRTVRMSVGSEGPGLYLDCLDCSGFMPAQIRANWGMNSETMKISGKLLCFSSLFEHLYPFI